MDLFIVNALLAPYTQREHAIVSTLTTATAPSRPPSGHRHQRQWCHCRTHSSQSPKLLPPPRRLCFHLCLFVCLAVNSITEKLSKFMEWLDIIQGPVD